MYVEPNFKTKKALQEAVKAKEAVYIFSPGPFPAPRDGVAWVEGPQYPQPNRWYAKVRIEMGRVLEVLE